MTHNGHHHHYHQRAMLISTLSEKYLYMLHWEHLSAFVALLAFLFCYREGESSAAAPCKLKQISS